MTYRDKNDDYFSKNLSRFITRYGGKWVIISGGRLVGVGPKKSLKRFFEIAKKRNPNEIPLVAPIPTREQVGHLYPV